MTVAISVILPAYNAARELPRALAPLLRLLQAGEVTEVIVVDDCSTDATLEIARQTGVKVLQTPRNAGPAAARNLGVTRATGAILWFVDADVVVHEDGPSHIRARLASADVVAVFGSYDDRPEARGWLSRYKNLVHRFHHQAAGPQVSTFWAGCGAVRTEAFHAAGGFDAEAYPVSSVEDIELGYRLARLGRIVVEPGFEATHLKDWRLLQVLRADIFRRALPWSRLILRREGLSDSLNIGRVERLRAAVALALVLALAAMIPRPDLWPLVVLLAGSALLLNLRLFGYLRRNGGVFFALSGLLYHQIYYVYSSVVFVWCMLERPLRVRT
jgi:glycosyltransferase involved in cell wall biosynthesis